MKTSSQAEISIRANISTTQLLIIHILTQDIIIITGTQMTTQELRRNLHLIMACLNNHLRVSHKLEKAKLMLFITASHAE